MQNAPNSPGLEERAVRSRSKSATFSLKSDKSGSSSNSKPKIRFGRETHEEKERLHLSITGKANPNAAMNEVQPIAAALEAPTIESLRSVQHVDTFGNPISEPDLSNPTRPRWERPLDTIRSFEAAIEGEYKRRSNAQTRPSTAMFSDSGVGFQSRRNSYFGVDHYQGHSRFSQAGSQFGGYYNRNRDSYADDGGYGYGPPPPMSPPNRMRSDRRQYSEPVMNRYNGPPNPSNPPREGLYPSPGYQRSRDTVNTGISNGSHSQSEPWANNTDPSSENSSIERTNAAPKPDPAEQYGFTGFGGTPFNNIAEETASHGELAHPPGAPGNGSYGRYYNQQPQAPPQPPPHGYPNYPNNPQRQRNTLVKLGNTTGPPPVPGKDGVQVTATPALQSTPSQKKKSWLKRRFSKKD